MTDMLKELEAVAGLSHRLDELSDAVANQRWNEFSMRVPAEPNRDADLVLSTVARFIRTHHAEIAEAVKDARRWRIVRELDGGAIYHVLGDCDGIHHELADAAIDAHNSAREVGE